MWNYIISLLDWIAANPATFTNILVALATLILAIATFQVARYTKKTIEAQFKPWVVMFLELDEQGSALDLVIENIGTAPAFDIKFDLPEYFPHKAFGDTMPINMERGPLRNGMRYLAPRGRWMMLWGDYPGLKKGLDGKPMEVKISFKTATGEPETTISVLDVRDFEIATPDGVLRRQEITALKSQADSLTKTAKTLEAIKNKMPSPTTNGNNIPQD